MNRRKLKKQIPGLVQPLVAPVYKLLKANTRVHPDIIANYEKQIEFGVLKLMQVYLTLDSSWPHRERWLDGLSEDFRWERRNGTVYGSGELFWGHWPEVSREIIGLKFTIVLQPCHRHGVDYQFRFGDSDNARTFASKCSRMIS